jgi:hypothetical protein
MEEEFYAAIKLVSGEEVFAIVSPSHEEDEIVLVLDNPVIIEPIVSRRNGTMGYKVKPWMNIPDDEIYIIKMDKVITMTEIKDNTIIGIYKKFLNSSSRIELNNRRMGFISKVDDARRYLEKIYNSN